MFNTIFIVVELFYKMVNESVRVGVSVINRRWRRYGMARISWLLKMGGYD